jgi:hypothetical protein
LVVGGSTESVEQARAEHARQHERDDDNALVTEASGAEAADEADGGLDKAEGDVEQDGLACVEPEALDDERAAARVSTWSTQRKRERSACLQGVRDRSAEAGNVSNGDGGGEVRVLT